MNENALYNKIGTAYNETRRADRFLTERFRRFLSPAANENYLDVGCGTGNYTCALAVGEDYKFYGVDPSETMLEKARLRNCNVIWQTGAAENLPFENEFFTGVIASLTIHHWKDLQKAFSEISRVLKSTGTFVLFTTLPEQTAAYWLTEYFPKMMKDSVDQLPPLSAIENALTKANLKIENRENYFVRDDLEDLFLYSGKPRPEIYLQAEIRRGISSFSNLANAEEVEKGLRRLSEDIESGKISEVIEKYKNNIGDYLFLVAGKTNQAIFETKDYAPHSQLDFAFDLPDGLF
jgi:ubiquinone/menaquinone biosynthesis C-methylase UbiE